MGNKSKSAFQTIAEVGQEIGVATHVLRFWETKFSQISPMKTRSGRRYYRPDDIELIKLIKYFLYEKRYTIEGVQKIFKEHGVKAFLNGDIQKDFFESSLQADCVKDTYSQTNTIQTSQLLNIKDEMLDLKNTLKQVLEHK